ncbi:unnamed protein product [Ectocarpus sp. 12 AP-2014]
MHHKRTSEHLYCSRIRLPAVALLTKSEPTRSSGVSPHRDPLKTSAGSLRESNMHKNMQRRLVVQLFRHMRTRPHGPHLVEHIWASLIRHPHQVSHKRPKRSSTSGSSTSSCSSVNPTTKAASLFFTNPYLATTFSDKARCEFVTAHNTLSQ